MAQKLQQQPHDTLARYLRASGRRCTAERMAVLDAVLATAGHFSAEQLRAAVHAAGCRVSVATVYSSLEILVDCGLAACHRFTGGNTTGALYERISNPAETRSHQHLVCTRCGKITQMRDPDLTAMVGAKRFTGFTPAYYTLDIYGVCGACQRKQRRKSLNSKK